MSRLDREKRLIGQLWKLESRREALRLECNSIDAEIAAIKRALRPRRHGQLKEAIIEVFKKVGGAWLTKSNIISRLGQAGFTFDAKDSKNSTAIVLRRLVKSRGCEMRRSKIGNLYRYKPPSLRTWDPSIEPEKPAVKKSRQMAKKASKGV